MTTYACNHFVVLYLEKNEQDSVQKYNALSMSILNKMRPKDQSYALGNLGAIKLFLILQEMGMTDKQMTHILGVSDGALRTTRSRLRQKRIAALTP